MRDAPTPGQVCYEAFFRQRAGTSLAQDVAWGYPRLAPQDRAAWEAAAQALRPPLTPWERTWLLARLSPLGDGEREIWCLFLETYVGDHGLARAIYDRTSLPLEGDPHG